MKKLVLVVFMSLCSNWICAQDVIVKKDGSTILSKILEVNIDDIKYIKHSNPNGPTYTIKKSDVMSINYENGEKEDYSNYDSSGDASTSGPQFVYKPADARNDEIIALYNRERKPTNKIKPAKENAKRCLVLVGIKESSVMSNDELEICFEMKKDETPYGVYYWSHGILVKNKTNRTIYIDKAYCFRSENDENDFNYYNPSSKRIIALAPQTSRYLVDESWNGNKWLEGFERFRFKTLKPTDIGLHKGDVRVGEVKTFNDGDLPWNRKYIITYSFDESYKSYSALIADLYIKSIIGCEGLMNPMNYRPGLGGLFEGELKYDKFILDFDSYTIVGYHKFDTYQTEYTSASFVAESLGKKKDNVELVNAIAGASFSAVNMVSNGNQNGMVIGPNISLTGEQIMMNEISNQLNGDIWKNGVPVTPVVAPATTNIGNTGLNSAGSSSNGTHSSYSSSNNNSSSNKSKGPVCRNCNGGGKCPSCHGKGIRTDNSFGTGTDASKKCGVCGGDGVCNMCGGSGHKN